MNKKNQHPPQFGQWLLSLIIDNDIRYEALGDFHEIFYYKAEHEGKLKAFIWYWMQVIKSLFYFLSDSTYWRIDMFKNYFKVAYRNLKRHKGYSFINIAGLSVGLACCIIIMAWVMDELSYDKHYKNGENIYRITYTEEIGGKCDHFALASFAAASAFTRELPEVLNYTRLDYYPKMISYNGKKFTGNKVFYADSTFFSIFNNTFIAGDPQTAFRDPKSIIITRTSADKVFGNENPMGKTISLDGKTDYQITGVVEDVPQNSHFRYDFITSIKPLQEKKPEHFAHWLSIMGWSYVVLQDGADINTVEVKMNEIAQIHAGELANKYGTKIDFRLQKLTDIHLKSHLQGEMSINGDINHVYIFSIIALFILLIALINFINLTTAKSGTRSREIGLRKVLGANRGKLISQFLSESFVISFMSLILALLVINFILPVFNAIANKNITIEHFISLKIAFGIFILIIISILGAGSFPAFILSKFDPVISLKGLSGSTKNRAYFRNFLVIIQFSISIILIISTLIVVKQLDFMKNKDLGFNKEQILVIKIKGNGIQDKFEVFKNELLQNSNIHEAVYSGGIPGGVSRVLTVFQEGKDASETNSLDVIRSDFDFVKTYDLKLINGRTFSKEFASDTNGVFIINETAAVKFGWGINAIGKKIGYSANNLGPIVGIVKDFHYRSLKNKIAPVVIELTHKPLRYLSLKINAENSAEVIPFIEKKWKEFETERSLAYFFADERFNSLYKVEEKINKLIKIFAVVGIFIASLGLLGLAAFSIEKRTKEIGIRKVLGASVSGLVKLLSMEFLKWVILANIIAWPVAFIVMDKWLMNFAYKIDMDLYVFILSGIVTLLIAFLTVSYQAIKAARSNPVDTLKYE